MHWASGGHSCNAGAETPLGAKPGCLWMIREKPCYSGFAWPMLQGFTVYCTDWKENALLVQNTGEESGSREAAFWGASGSVFLTGLLEKGLWPKIRLIYSHVRIAPHPNCKEWVEMGAADSSWCWCGSPAVPSTVEEDEQNKLTLGGRWGDKWDLFEETCFR